MKACIKCGIWKPLSEYYENRKLKLKDGHINTCKVCIRIYSTNHYANNTEKHHAYSRLWKEQNRKKVLASDAKYRAKHRNRINEKLREKKASCNKTRKAYRATPFGKMVTRESNRKWAKANRHKRNAEQTLFKAVKAGTITRLPCMVCGDHESHGHHEDYTKPLEVIWLCCLHHGEIHRIKREGIL